MNKKFILVQTISIYRAISIFLFILFYKSFSNFSNSIILITSISSDILDGYLSRKFKVASVGGQLLDLFSDKYLNLITIIYLIIENYPLLPLLLIITKEIFVLSFRSIKLNGKFILKTNRILGGTLSFSLYSIVIFSINSLYTSLVPYFIYILGFLNLIYLIYKISINFSDIKKIFKS